MELKAAVVASDVCVAEMTGFFTDVSTDLVLVAADYGTTQSYRLAKFDRSNQGTSYNQRVLVDEGDRVEPGSVLADGPSTDEGELALGRNLLVASMAWACHTHDDTIVLDKAVPRHDAAFAVLAFPRQERNQNAAS